MSEETYTRIAQAIILIVFVLGMLYADPAAPASTRQTDVREQSTILK